MDKESKVCVINNKCCGSFILRINKWCNIGNKNGKEGCCNKPEHPFIFKIGSVLSCALVWKALVHDIIHINRFVFLIYYICYSNSLNCIEMLIYFNAAFFTSIYSYLVINGIKPMLNVIKQQLLVLKYPDWFSILLLLNA